MADKRQFPPGTSNEDVLNGWGKLISFIGVPSAIALYLVYTFTTGINADVKVVKESMILHTQMSESQGSTNTALLKALQRVCVNTSKTAADRSQCF